MLGEVVVARRYIQGQKGPEDAGTILQRLLRQLWSRWTANVYGLSTWSDLRGQTRNYPPASQGTIPEDVGGSLPWGNEVRGS